MIEASTYLSIVLLIVDYVFAAFVVLCLPLDSEQVRLHIVAFTRATNSSHIRQVGPVRRRNDVVTVTRRVLDVDRARVNASE